MKYIWLSHQFTIDTPMYGGAKDFKIIKENAIENGDSCNTSSLVLPSHTGTHVDAPRHFIQNGKCIEDYPSEEWVFNSVQVINFNAAPGQIIDNGDLDIKKNSSTEIILLRSSFEQWRGDDLYWEQNPGLSPELADYMIGLCPKLKIIGMDFISISSYMHREIGRKAHRTFLSKNIRLIEDMHLKALKEEMIVSQVIVMPIRFYNAEGSPCTILCAVT